MGGSATADDVGRRIGLFCVGLAVATISAFVGWIAFALPTVDTSAEWWHGAPEARSRMAHNPDLATVVVVSAAFPGLGAGCVGWAVVGCRLRSPTKDHT
jgi:hypothetical protein